MASKSEACSMAGAMVPSCPARRRARPTRAGPCATLPTERRSVGEPARVYIPIFPARGARER